MADSPQVELSENEKVVTDRVKAGQPVERGEATRILGHTESIAWFDTVDIPETGSEALAAHAQNLEPNQFIACEVSHIPKTSWERHRADYARPGGHGLKLQDKPAVLGVFKDGNGKLGVLVGYAKADVAKQPEPAKQPVVSTDKIG